MSRDDLSPNNAFRILLKFILFDYLLFSIDNCLLVIVYWLLFMFVGFWGAKVVIFYKMRA